jgi:hypothetical protein
VRIRMGPEPVKKILAFIVHTPFCGETNVTRTEPLSAYTSFWCRIVQFCRQSVK